MSNDETQLKLDYIKWLIDRQKNDLTSFRSRIFEIIGVNAVIISILWSRDILSTEFQTFKDYVNFIEIIVYLLLFFGEVICLIYVSIPRKSSIQLIMKEKITDALKNMMEYNCNLKIYVKRRARITRLAYRLFFAQMFIIMSTLFISIYPFFLGGLSIIIIVETIMVIFILFTNDRIILKILDKTLER